MHKKTTWILCLSIFFLFYFLVSAYYWAIKPTDESYSFVQKWKHYYPLENWNYPHYQVIDIDNDGKKDFIETTGCVFLSSVKNDNIDARSRCAYIRQLTILEVSGDTFKKGQLAVDRKKLIGPSLMNESHLVETLRGNWKIYSSTGFNVSVFQLEGNGIFKEQNPTFLDIVDAYTYQLVHLGVVISVVYFVCLILYVLIYTFWGAIRPQKMRIQL